MRAASVAPSRWAWSGAVGGVLMVIVAYAPASWLASTIAVASEGRVLMTEPRGSVWSGSSGLVLSGGEGSAGAVSLPSRMSWTVTPNWSGVAIQLEAPCCTPQEPLLLRATVGRWKNVSIALVAAPFHLPARMLTGLGAPWNTLQLDGTLSLVTRNLETQWSVQHGLVALTGQATLEAQSIETALSTVRPLGSYRLSLSGSALRLETIPTSPNAEPAALLLTGTGQWLVQKNSPSKASFTGEALAATGREAALTNLIHIIGQRQPSTDGRVRSSLSLS